MAASASKPAKLQLQGIEQKNWLENNKIRNDIG
jgi:hypothetical protein